MHLRRTAVSTGVCVLVCFALATASGTAAASSVAGPGSVAAPQSSGVASHSSKVKWPKGSKAYDVCFTREPTCPNERKFVVNRKSKTWELAAEPGENADSPDYFGGSFTTSKSSPFTVFYYEHVYKASYPELCKIEAIKTKKGYEQGSYYCKDNSTEPWTFYETVEIYKP